MVRKPLGRSSGGFVDHESTSARRLQGATRMIVDITRRRGTRRSRGHAALMELHRTLHPTSFWALLKRVKRTATPVRQLHVMRTWLIERHGSAAAIRTERRPIEYDREAYKRRNLIDVGASIAVEAMCHSASPIAAHAENRQSFPLHDNAAYRCCKCIPLDQKPSTRPSPLGLYQ